MLNYIDNHGLVVLGAVLLAALLGFGLWQLFRRKPRHFALVTATGVTCATMVVLGARLALHPVPLSGSLGGQMPRMITSGLLALVGAVFAGVLVYVVIRWRMSPNRVRSGNQLTASLGRLMQPRPKERHPRHPFGSAPASPAEPVTVVRELPGTVIDEIVARESATLHTLPDGQNPKGI